MKESPLSPLKIAGNFQTSGGKSTATGSLPIGHEPAGGAAFVPTLRLEGTATYDDKFVTLIGTFYPIGGDDQRALMQGTIILSRGSATASSVQDQGASDGLTVAGQEFDVAKLTFASTHLDFTAQGNASRRSSQGETFRLRWDRRD